MNHLLRSLAPISDSGWELDFAGPSGWEHSATNLGRVKKVKAAPVEGVMAQ
jgi:hypothetical protein